MPEKPPPPLPAPPPRSDDDGGSMVGLALTLAAVMILGGIALIVLVVEALQRENEAPAQVEPSR